MSRRLLALFFAVVLAVVGAGILFVYVSSADQRAMRGLDPVTVLQVAQPVPEGTPAENLDDLVEENQVPAKAVAPGALSSLDEIEGQVATTTLQPGEQLLATRFIDRQTYEESRPLEVPAEMQQVSLLLEPERVLGGYLEPGVRVGVFVSMDEPEETRMILNHTLVTRVQNGIAMPQSQQQPSNDDETDAEAIDPAAAPPPSDGVMVTLAVKVKQADEVVFGAEHGTVYLSLQPETAEQGSKRLLDRSKVLR